MKRFVAVIMVVLIALPGAIFGCGGNTNSSGGGGGGHGHKRQKRSPEEKRARQQARDAQRNYQHDANKELLLESIDMGHGTYSRHSPAKTRELMENRLVHLLQKYKNGKMTNEEAAEAQYLMKVLSN